MTEKHHLILKNIVDHLLSSSNQNVTCSQHRIAGIVHMALNNNHSLFCDTLPSKTLVTCSLKLSNEKGVKNPRDPMLNAITGGTLV